MAQLNVKGIDDDLFTRLKVYVAGIRGLTMAKVLAEAIREYLDRRRGTA